MSKPNIYVASAASRPSREKREHWLGEFARTGFIATVDYGLAVEVMNHCMSRRVGCSLRWEGSDTVVVERLGRG